ncbi:hypothetical protein GCM10020295_16350 [Streptomyces cinereospinus]
MRSRSTERGGRAGGAGAGAGEQRGQGVGLLPGRGHGPGHHVVLFRAVPDRVDPRVAGAQVSVHDDAGAHGESGAAGQAGPGDGAGAQDDVVRRQSFVAVEAEVARSVPGRGPAQQQPDTELAEPLGEQVTGGGVQSPVHRVRRPVHEGDVVSALTQGHGRFHAEHSGADHGHRPRRGGRAAEGRAQVPAVVQGAQHGHRDRWGGGRSPSGAGPPSRGHRGRAPVARTRVS